MIKVKAKASSIDSNTAKECYNRCGYQVTWHETHCCLACLHKRGKHGKKCEQRPFKPNKLVCKAASKVVSHMKVLKVPKASSTASKASSSASKASHQYEILTAIAAKSKGANGKCLLYSERMAEMEKRCEEEEEEEEEVGDGKTDIVAMTPTPPSCPPPGYMTPTPPSCPPPGYMTPTPPPCPPPSHRMPGSKAQEQACRSKVRHAFNMWPETNIVAKQSQTQDEHRGTKRLPLAKQSQTEDEHKVRHKTPTPPCPPGSKAQEQAPKPKVTIIGSILAEAKNNSQRLRARGDDAIV